MAHEEIDDPDELLWALSSTPQFVKVFARPLRLYLLAPVKPEEGEEWKEDPKAKYRELKKFEVKSISELNALMREVEAGAYREVSRCPLWIQMWTELALFAGFVKNSELVVEPPANSEKPKET
jgi:hypothetical protein